MKILRAIWIGILLWVAIFFEVSILMFGFKLQSPDVIYYIIHYFLLVLFVAIAGLFYFRKSKAKAGNGLFLGLIFILVGIALDSIITIPLFMNGDYGFLITGEMLISYAVTLIVSMIVCVIKK